MLLPSEPLGDRLRRRMRERKARKLAEAAKLPARREPTERTMAVEDQKAVQAELRAIDARMAEIEALLGQPTPRSTFGVNAPSYRENELRAELGELAYQRREIESDLERPINRWPDGRPLTARDRAYRRTRTREIAENDWAMSDRAEREGDHRRARRLRCNSLRARHIAEFEMHLRPSLRGFTHAG